MRLVGHAHHGAGYFPRLCRLRPAVPHAQGAGDAGKDVSRWQGAD